MCQYAYARPWLSECCKKLKSTKTQKVYFHNLKLGCTILAQLKQGLKRISWNKF